MILSFVRALEEFGGNIRNPNSNTRYLLNPLIYIWKLFMEAVSLDQKGAILKNKDSVLGVAFIGYEILLYILLVVALALNVIQMFILLKINSAINFKYLLIIFCLTLLTYAIVVLISKIEENRKSIVGYWAGLSGKNKLKVTITFNLLLVFTMFLILLPIN